MITLRLFNQYIPLSFLVLAFLEFFLGATSFLVAIYLRFHNVSWFSLSDRMGIVLSQSLIFASVVCLSLAAFGLYQRRSRLNYVGQFVRLLTGFIAAIVMLSLIYYIIPESYAGRGVLALAGAISFIGIVLIRMAFFRIISGNILQRQVLIMGAGNRAGSLMMLRRRVDRHGFNIVGFIRMPGDDDFIDSSYVLDVKRPLLDYVHELHVDEIVVAMDDRRSSLPLQELLDCKMNGIDVLDVQSFFERESGKIVIDVLRTGWLIFSEGFAQNMWHCYMKRGIDIFVSLAALLVSLVVTLPVALLIKLEDRGPVFYSQLRVGRNGKVFRVYKFRSMRVDAEKDGSPQWAKKDDDRVTKMGKFIRKTRIDELPQIFNVLRGDMSIVGPRPERPEFVKELSTKIPYFDTRHQVKPGITGWAQICYPYGASEKDSLEKLQYDLYYAKNHNLLMDMSIILQTIEVILFGKGAR